MKRQFSRLLIEIKKAKKEEQNVYMKMSSQEINYIVVQYLKQSVKVLLTSDCTVNIVSGFQYFYLAYNINSTTHQYFYWSA